MASQKDLDLALECLQREDPSLKVEVNQETGQTILSGMGELHLEVIKHRILLEFKVDAYMGPLQIAYRETIKYKVTHTEILESTVGGSKHHAGITLTVSPSTDANRKRNVLFKPLDEKSFMMTPKFRMMYKSAIDSAVKISSYGPILNFPVINVDVIIHNADLSCDASPIGSQRLSPNVSTQH